MKIRPPSIDCQAWSRIQGLFNESFASELATHSRARPAQRAGPGSCPKGEARKRSSSACDRLTIPRAGGRLKASSSAKPSPPNAPCKALRAMLCKLAAASRREALAARRPLPVREHAQHRTPVFSPRRPTLTHDRPQGAFGLVQGVSVKQSFTNPPPTQAQPWVCLWHGEELRGTVQARAACTGNRQQLSRLGI